MFGLWCVVVMGCSFGSASELDPVIIQVSVYDPAFAPNPLMDDEERQRVLELELRTLATTEVALGTYPSETLATSFIFGATRLLAYEEPESACIAERLLRTHLERSPPHPRSPFDYLLPDLEYRANVLCRVP